MGIEADRRLTKLAVKQLGVVTSRQCAEAGIPPKALQRRIASGVWTRLHWGVFKLAPHPPSLDEQELAAILAAGRGAVLSHESAARRLGLDVPRNSKIQITVPESRRVGDFAGVRVWRSRTLVPRDVGVRGPFCFTKVGRTVLDLAAVLDNGWLRAVVDSALRLNGGNGRWISLALEWGGSGRAGAGRLRSLINEHDEPVEIADSVLESLAMELSLATGSRPRLHHRILQGRHFLAEVDLAWPEACVCVELDSWRYHGSRTAFIRDRVRDRALTAAGWTVLRYTWHDIVSFKEQVVVELRRILSLGGTRSSAVAARSGLGGP